MTQFADKVFFGMHRIYGFLMKMDKVLLLGGKDGKIRQQSVDKSYEKEVL